MLERKEQGDSMNEVLLASLDCFEGPPSSTAKTTSGHTYIYISYALSAQASSSNRLYLWSQVWPTLCHILVTSPEPDPVILWREKPEINESDGMAYMFMRCVAIPRADVENIIPLEEPAKLEAV